MNKGFETVEKKKKNRNTKNKKNDADKIYQYILQHNNVTPEEIQKNLNIGSIYYIWELLDADYLREKLECNDYKYKIKK